MESSLRGLLSIGLKHLIWEVGESTRPLLGRVLYGYGDLLGDLEKDLLMSEDLDEDLCLDFDLPADVGLGLEDFAEEVVLFLDPFWVGV